jgi:hypothetical protein
MLSFLTETLEALVEAAAIDAHQRSMALDARVLRPTGILSRFLDRSAIRYAFPRLSLDPFYAEPEPLPVNAPGGSDLGRTPTNPWNASNAPGGTA